MNRSLDHNHLSDSALSQWMEASNHHLVVTVFYAEWAGSVEILRGFMQKICAEQPGVEVQWVDIETQQDLALNLGVSQVPSLIMFRNQEVVDYISGVIPRRKIAQRMQAFA